MKSSLGHVEDDMLVVVAPEKNMDNPRLLQEIALAADQGLYGSELWSNRSATSLEMTSGSERDSEVGASVRSKSPKNKDRQKKVLVKKYDRSPDGHEARIAKVWGRELTDCEKVESGLLFKLQKNWIGIATEDAKYGTWREENAALGLTLGKDLANQIKATNAKNSPAGKSKKNGISSKGSSK